MTDPVYLGKSKNYFASVNRDDKEKNEFLSV